jgi:3-mercaptopyruvate sulfurtransferase SseA
VVQLKSKGIQNVAALLGGFNLWKQENRPVDKKPVENKPDSNKK